jgi:molecular chaperone DnaK
MDILFGIDFGTTNTVISYFENNKVKILMDGNFKTIPSKICNYSDKYYCGNYIPLNSTNIIINFKNDNNIELLVIFFKHLHNLITKTFNLDNIKAVITVPSNFNDKQRETIKTAFDIVKINVIRMINEPSAAALAYGLNHSAKYGDKILVVDTGGGTMDFTILETYDDLFEVIHSEGLNDLGGNNFTQIVLNDIKHKINIKNNDEYILWHKAEQIKQKLSYLDSYQIKINNELYSLNRKTFNQLCNTLINKIDEIVKNIINNYEIDYIILVGGSSKLLLLQDIIKQVTKKKIWIHPNLDTVVAEGAGLYAGIIENKFSENNDVVLLDVVPLSLGIELSDGTFSIIIPKNTPLPVRRTQKYTSDINTNIKVKVYQGERKIANKNLLIGEFEIDKLSNTSTPVIDITFRVDINSIINIGIIDKKSGNEKIIILKDISKLDDNKINDLINAATKLSDVDTNELIRKQNIYTINNYIENSIIQLQLNNLINNEDKAPILNRFNIIEENINNYTNIQLLDIVSELELTCKLLITNNNNDYKQDNEIDNELLNNNKEDLRNRINILLNKNPEWKEYLEPVLEELSYSNVSSDYIDEKLKLLIELENDKEKDYKSEFHNLCLYIKSEIELGNIKLNEESTEKLINLINANLDLLNNNGNNEEYDWENKIKELNTHCMEIYN